MDIIVKTVTGILNEKGAMIDKNKDSNHPKLAILYYSDLLLLVEKAGLTFTELE